jgi:inner membrane protein
MTVKSHVIFAYLPLAIAFKENILPLNNTELLIEATVGTFIGSVLPDIDEPNSYIGNKFPFLSKFLNFLGLKHRTFTHSFIFVLLIVLLGIIHPIFYFIAFGIFMHILGDVLTKSGVPFFYPAFDTRFSLGLFKTGSLGEFLFIGVMSGFVLYYFFH